MMFGRWLRQGREPAETARQKMSLKLPPEKDGRLQRLRAGSYSLLAEPDAIQALHEALAPMQVSWRQVVEIWIGLKSKPGLILRAALESTAGTLATRIIHSMLGRHSPQQIVLQGHPLWVPAGPHQAQLIGMQQWLTSEQVRLFLTEAGKAVQRDALHFMLIRGIGPAELHAYFVQVPRQLQALGGVLDLPRNQVAVPTAVAGNVVFVATEGHDLGRIDQPEVLDFCSIHVVEGPVHTAGEAVSTTSPGAAILQPALAAHRTLDPLAARMLIPPARKHEALAVVGEGLTLLAKHALNPRPGVLRDAYLLLGHAWSIDGQGLFSKKARENIRLASELWLAQSFIARTWRRARKHPGLHKDVLRYLQRDYPRCAAIWRDLSDSDTP